MSHTVVLAAEKPFSKDATAKIQAIADKAGYKLVPVQSYKNIEDLYVALADAEGLIVRSDKVDEKMLERAPKLKIVVRAGAGYDTIDLAACTKREIVVMNTPGQNSNAVAELVFGFLIQMARCGFNGKMGSELRGKVLGMHGYGNIASWVLLIARGFGMECAAYDPYVSAEKMAADGVKPVQSLAELYATSDIVSIHTPANKETKGSVDATILQSMKKGAMLVNTARAEIVVDAALKEMLEKRPDFKYGTDVISSVAFGNELKAAFPDRVFFSTVKSGAQTDEANTNCGTASIAQIVAFFEKGETKFQVNKAK